MFNDAIYSMEVLMNIEVFNETKFDLDKELAELKEYLTNISKDLELTSGEFNVIIVDNKKIREINIFPIFYFN